MMFSELALDKLIILFVMETMEIPLQNETLTDICTANDWVGYMECKQCIADLIDANFVTNMSKNSTKLYVLSNDGRECLKLFFTKIPLSIRDNIKLHVREHCQEYKRKQEYFSDYFKNNDGSYTVILKINTPAQPLMELKLCVNNKNTAKWLYKQWIDKAPNVYEVIYDTLLV